MLELKRQGLQIWGRQAVGVGAGLCGRGTGVAVPLRVVPSPTGLPSKRWGTFGVASRVPSSISNFMTKHGTSPETL